MEDKIGAKEGYKPSSIKYSLRNIYKETCEPPTS